MSSMIQSPSHSELLGKGEAPIFVFSATSQEKSPSEHEQKGLHPNIKEELVEASTKLTTKHNGGAS